MSLQKILKVVAGYDCRLVEITGGEPLLQQETPQLARELLNLNLTVLVETNGTQDLNVLPAGTVCIMDIKCPGSNEHEKTDWNNIDRLDANDEIKFVLSDRSDYEWAIEIIMQHNLQKRNPILMSPVQELLNPSDLASWILEDKLNVRFQLQLHKIIWPGNETGR